MRVVRAFLVVCAAVIAATFIVSADQLRLPKLPRNVPKDIPRLDRLPSLDDLLNRQPLTSSLADAVTEVAFLDRFDPPAASPLLELPMGLDDGVTLVPGTWDARLQSYCLKAGTYGPTRGDGYLWAPLKGPKADVINAILTKSAFQPDIPQSDIQVLLWGIIARTKVSQLADGPQAAARKLLSESQIASIDGSALEVIPDEWIRKITGPLDGIVRRALEAENKLRQAFANPGAAAYDELERIAVLNGVPSLQERGRDVPARRWSFHPNGYYIRFMPDSYREMQLQIYVPERFVATTNAADRVAALRDVAGSEIAVEYGANGAIAKAMFTPAGGASRELAVRGSRDAQESARDAMQAAKRFAGSSREGWAIARDAEAVAQITAAVDDPEASAFLARAWASAVGDWAKADAVNTAALEQARYLSASARGFFARPRVTPAAGSRGWGGGGGGGSGGAGGGGGGMPGGGRQRLGPSLRKFADDPTAQRARRAIDGIGTAKNAMDLTDPAGIFGFGIPDALFGKILDFNFDTWGKASDALAGDPPRPDFREFAKPEIEDVPKLQAGAKVTAAQAERFNAFLADLVAANAHLRAAIVALDRHGGAVQAGERAWASRQAHALTHLKREAGVLSLRAASHLDVLAESAPRSEPLKQAAESLRSLGGHFASLPAVGAPWEPR